MELLQKQNKQTLLTLLPARIVGCPKLADATSLALPKSSVLGSASCAYDAYVCLCIISIHFIISSFQWIVNCANLGQEAHGPPPHKTLVIWTETMSSYPVMGCDAVPYPKIFIIRIIASSRASGYAEGHGSIGCSYHNHGHSQARGLIASILDLYGI